MIYRKTRVMSGPLNVSSSSRTRRRKSATETDTDEVDRLNDLPDAVLQEIISHLPIEEAIDTRFLSKRWRCIWRSMPTLEFVEDKRRKNRNHDLHHSIGFLTFVERVLYSRNHLLAFSYTRHHSPVDVTRLGTWMMFLAQIKVQRVHLEISFPNLGEFPGVLFKKSAALQEFVLTTYGYERPSIMLPRVACSASHIRTLTLNSVHLPPGTNGELVINCPLMQNLTMINCIGGHLTCLLVSSSRLINLVLANGRLSVCCSCDFKLDAPNLQSFTSSGSFYRTYHLQTLSSLVSFTLVGASFGWWGTHLFPSTCLFKFLQVVSNVTNLAIPSSYSEIPLINEHQIGGCHPYEIQSAGRRRCLHNILKHPKASDGSSVNQVLNPFRKLKRLKLTGLQNGSCSGYVAEVLKGALSIETLVFEFEEPKDVKGKDWEADLPGLAYDHVKCVKILNFRHCAEELTFLACVLKNAPVLKDVIICYKRDCPWYYDEVRLKIGLEEVTEKLGLYPRASPSAKIQFRQY